MHVRSFFERPTTAAEPDAQCAAADPDTRLRIETVHHLIERDVLLLFDHPEDDGLVRIEGRPTPPALRPGRSLAYLKTDRNGELI
jgi:hypothetical protein